MRKCHKALLLTLLFLVVVGVFVGILLVVPSLDKDTNDDADAEKDVNEDGKTPEGDVDTILVPHNPDAKGQKNNNILGAHVLLYPFYVNDHDGIIQYEKAHNINALNTANIHKDEADDVSKANFDEELSLIPSDTFAAVPPGDYGDVEPEDKNRNGEDGDVNNVNLDEELPFIPSDNFPLTAPGDFSDGALGGNNQKDVDSDAARFHLDDVLSFIPSDTFGSGQPADITDVLGGNTVATDPDDELLFIPSDNFSVTQPADIAIATLRDNDTSAEERVVELQTVNGTDFQTGLDAVLSLFSLLKTEHADGNPHQLLVKFFGTDAIKLGELFKRIEPTFEQIRENFYWLVDPAARVPKVPLLPQGLFEDALVALPANLEIILKAANTLGVEHKDGDAEEFDNSRNDLEGDKENPKAQNRHDATGVLHKCEDVSEDLLGIVDILVKHWIGFRFKHSVVLKLALEWLLIFYDKINKARINAWNKEFEQWLLTLIPTNGHTNDAGAYASNGSVNAREQDVLTAIGVTNLPPTRSTSTSTKVLANTCLDLVFAGYDELLAYALLVTSEPPSILEQQQPPCQYILTPFFDVVSEFFNILAQNAPTAAVSDNGTNSTNDKKNEAIVQVMTALQDIFKTHNRNNLHYQKLGDAEKFYTAGTELLQLLRHLYPLLQEWKRGKMDEIKNTPTAPPVVSPRAAAYRAQTGHRAFKNRSWWNIWRLSKLF